MQPDLQKFFRACNPAKTLRFEDTEERKYYVDFSSVQGAKLVEQLKQTIAIMSPEPTCQLFTGHIGCGKSTELLRLKAELQIQGFHVVYVVSDRDLYMGDVDISDILLAIARQVSESLEAAQIRLQPGYFTKLLQESFDFLKSPVELGVEAELSLGIGKLTAKTKESPQVRHQLRQYLEPQTDNLLNAINEELLEQATLELQKRGKEGIVAIVDNLDRVDNRLMGSGKTLPEYLFIDRGEQLGRLKCHVVYTIPLVLTFSNELEALTNRLGGQNPKVLPMIPVKLRDGTDNRQALALLRQMILARAFPELKPEERLDLILKVFDSSETLDRLCQISGGHVRNLLRLLFMCLNQSNLLPITKDKLERAIQESANTLSKAIDDDEWETIAQVAQSKKVSGERKYSTLLRSLFVFEYRNEGGDLWFDVNPLLAEVKRG